VDAGSGPAAAGEGGPSALQQALEEAAGGGSKLGPAWLSGGGGEQGGAEWDASCLSYEELCRAHIEKLIAAAAAQQVESDLQVRVSTWRQRIDPVLSAEEDRSAFDIHDYGGAILERLDDNNIADNQTVAIPFQRVVACDNRFEVARMFAAMLQLVNNRWVRRTTVETWRLGLAVHVLLLKHASKRPMLLATLNSSSQPDLDSPSHSAPSPPSYGKPLAPSHPPGMLSCARATLKTPPSPLPCSC